MAGKMPGSLVRVRARCCAAYASLIFFVSMQPVRIILMYLEPHRKHIYL